MCHILSYSMSRKVVRQVRVVKLSRYIDRERLSRISYFWKIIRKIPKGIYFEDFRSFGIRIFKGSCVFCLPSHNLLFPLFRRRATHTPAREWTPSWSPTTASGHEGEGDMANGTEKTKRHEGWDGGINHCTPPL